jgi:hypothetical protein
MEKRLAYLSAQLDAAIEDFERSLGIPLESLDQTIADAVRNGQAQKFEFTIELFWKAARVFLLETHGFDLASPKPVIKKYFELGYVDYEDCDKLLHGLEIRNSLSHVYNKRSFLSLHAEILGFDGLFPRAAGGMTE